MDKQRETIKGISTARISVRAAFKGVSCGVRCLQGQRIQIIMKDQITKIEIRANAVIVYYNIPDPEISNIFTTAIKVFDRQSNLEVIFND